MRAQYGAPDVAGALGVGQAAGPRQGQPNDFVVGGGNPGGPQVRPGGAGDANAQAEQERRIIA